ncbi:MAG: hypothetical protein LBO64_07195 [Desulfovibrio sp.]|jgi:hypothetical protein|nr:hypothetical protein [Desulfovibrio sp.]
MQKLPGELSRNILDMVAMRVPVGGGIVEEFINAGFGTSQYLPSGMRTVFTEPIRFGYRAAQSIGDAEKMAWIMGDILSFVSRVPVTRIVRNAQRGYDQWQRGDGTPFSVVMPRPGK